MDKLHLETNSIGLCLEVKVSRRFKCMYNLGVLTRHFYMFIRVESEKKLPTVKGTRKEKAIDK